MALELNVENPISVSGDIHPAAAYANRWAYNWQKGAIMFEKIKEFINKYFRKGKSGIVRVVIEMPEDATIEYSVIGGGGGGGNGLRPTKRPPDASPQEA